MRAEESRETNTLTAGVDGFFLKGQAGPLLLCLLYLPQDHGGKMKEVEYWNINIGTPQPPTLDFRTVRNKFTLYGSEAPVFIYKNTKWTEAHPVWEGVK